MCECGSRDCVEWVELELPAYAQIRSCPDALVLAEGHSRVAIDEPGALRRDRVMTAMARKKLESRGRARSGA